MPESSLSPDFVAKIEECAELRVRLEGATRINTELNEQITAQQEGFGRIDRELTKAKETIVRLRKHIAAVRQSLKTLFDGLNGLDQ